LASVFGAGLVWIFFSPKTCLEAAESSTSERITERFLSEGSFDSLVKKA
jgi:hypothetical protein